MAPVKACTREGDTATDPCHSWHRFEYHGRAGIGGTDLDGKERLLASAADNHGRVAVIAATERLLA